MMRLIFSTKEVCQLLGINRRTLYDLRRKGLIEGRHKTDFKTIFYDDQTVRRIIDIVYRPLSKIKKEKLDGKEESIIK